MNPICLRHGWILLFACAAWAGWGTGPASAQPDLRDGGSGYHWIASGTTNVYPGNTIWIGGRITNGGSPGTGPFDTYVYLSTDTVITTSDRYIGQFRTNSIGGGISVDFTKPFVLPANTPPGTYYVGWILDRWNEVAESNEGNNNIAITYRRVIVLNSAPNRPTLTSPTNGATGVSLTPTLTASAFSDPDAGDYHHFSQWVVSRTANFNDPVFGYALSTDLTSVTLPGGTLQPNTTYYWTVQYRDQRGAWSPWATTRSFKTTSSGGGGTTPPIQKFDNIQPVVGHTVNRWAFMTAWNLTSGAFFQSPSWRNGVLTWEHNAWEYRAWIARFVYDQAGGQTRALSWYYRQVHVQ